MIFFSEIDEIEEPEQNILNSVCLGASVYNEVKIFQTFLFANDSRDK